MKNILLLCCLAISLNVAATEPKNDQLLIETVIDAKALKRVPPKYPKFALRSGKEGWVVMSYVIEPDGSVSYPIIESSSGVKGFERSALRSIKKWQYQPAMNNGEAIQQCRNSVRIDFALANKKPGASRKFVRKYNNISKLILGKELEQAQSEITKLRQSPKWNLYEDAWFWLLQADFYGAVGDEKNELTSLNRIIGNRNDYLPKGNYLSVLARIFRLNLKINKFAAALSIFGKIKALDSEDKISSTFQPYVDRINALIVNDELIAVSGDIGSDDFWHHKLIRSSFGFNNIEGELYKLDVRCNNKRSTFKIAEQKVWHIPKSWGQCTLYVYGADNSQFSLVELPQEKAG